MEAAVERILTEFQRIEQTGSQPGRLPGERGHVVEQRVTGHVGIERVGWHQEPQVGPGANAVVPTVVAPDACYTGGRPG